MSTRDKLRRSPVVRLELVPGNSQTIRDDGNWPRPAELKGQPVGMSLSFVDFANAPANQVYEAPPVLIEFCEGSSAWEIEGSLSSSLKR